MTGSHPWILLAAAGIGTFLLRLSFIALVRGDAETAARFLGGVEGHMKKIGAAFEPTDKADIDSYVDKARAALGDARFEQLSREGANTDWTVLRAEARRSAD